MVFGTPTTCTSRPASFVATPSVSSPPIAISASTPSSLRFAVMRSKPSSTLNGFVREEPRIVPPRGRMPRTSGMPSGIVSLSSGPRQPSRKPTNSCPYMPAPLRTTARMTAFNPGQSPPPVSTPIRMARHFSGPGAGLREGLGPSAGEGAPSGRQGPPAGEVVPRVGERVVLIGRRRREGRRAGVLPPLPQLVREARDRPGQRPHVAPQLAEGDVVVGGHPRPQLDRLPRLAEEREEVGADPVERAPGRIARTRELVQDVPADPVDRPGRIELGRDRVELPTGLVHDADGDELDRPAVLDELAVVEESHGTKGAASLSWPGCRARGR